MNIVLTGATGFLGRALVLRLLRDGHALTALVRDPARVADALGERAVAVPLTDAAAVARAVAAADAVVNLAGEGIADRRWSAARKRALRDSRLGVTRALADAIARRSEPLPVLVSASAVGWYGDRGDELLDETAGPGEGFAAELCRDWEAAAEHARGGARRVVRARIGVVLGAEGGALAALLPVFRAGAGGRVGSGRQWMPWIHLDDAIEAMVRALEDSSLDGVVNLVAPAPARNAEFAAALGRALGRPAALPAPAAALRLALGARASLVLGGQRVVPGVLGRTGFRWRFADLDGALRDAVGADAGVCLGAADPGRVPDAPYLRSRRPKYVLSTRTVIDAPVAEVFEFFSRADNLAAITPPSMGFRILTPRPIPMAPGTVIDYRVRVGGLGLGWRTVIEVWQPGAAFVDAQHRGPYRSWWHEHRFVADGDRTIMEDVVHYAPPLGPLGRIANRLFIIGQLRRIFAYRAAAIRLRFGDAPADAAGLAPAAVAAAAAATTAPPGLRVA